MTKQLIFSLDAETDGLWGRPFAIAAIVYNEKQENVDKIVLRLPNDVVENDWVKENVLPTLDFPVTHDINIIQTKKEKQHFEKAYEIMLKDFADFYLKYKDTAETLYHMGHIVEANLFREMHRLELIGDWDAPYTPIEVADHLRAINEPCDSVDSYVEKHNLEISNYGTTHNPLYDCEVAAKVYFDILNRNDVR